MPVDKRADIWAFGCVLFEMLTGRAAFSGGTISDTLVAIIQREPDWSALPPMSGVVEAPPATIAWTKDPRRRLRDIGDARLELDHSNGTAVSPADGAAASPHRTSRMMWPAVVARGVGRRWRQVWLVRDRNVAASREPARRRAVHTADRLPGGGTRCRHVTRRQICRISFRP